MNKIIDNIKKSKCIDEIIGIYENFTKNDIPEKPVLKNVNDISELEIYFQKIKDYKQKEEKYIFLKKIIEENIDSIEKEIHDWILKDLDFYNKINDKEKQESILDGLYTYSNKKLFKKYYEILKQELENYHHNNIILTMENYDDLSIEEKILLIKNIFSKLNINIVGNFKSVKIFPENIFLCKNRKYESSDDKSKDYLISIYIDINRC